MSKPNGKPRPEPTAKTTPAKPMVKSKVCKYCGEELHKDVNHLLVCPKLNGEEDGFDDSGFDEDEARKQLANPDEL